MTNHPTAEEVYTLARRRLPRLSLGTVYRNLEGLSTAGLVVRLDIGGGRRRFDGNPARHYHIRCLVCGRVDDVAAKLGSAVEAEVRKRTEYRILGYRLEFEGLCQKCRKRKD